MSFAWLRRWFVPESRSAKRRPRGPRFLPSFETLEDRLVPATSDGLLIGDLSGLGALPGILSGPDQPTTGPVTQAGGTAGAVLTVRNLSDSGPGSLRQALLDANSLPGDDTITFAAGVAGTIDLLSALPDLGSNIDLEGPGAAQVTVERSAAACTPTFGIFNVTSGATVTVARLTIANGLAASGGGISSAGALTVTGCVIRGNAALGLDGGGIFSTGGTLTVTDSVIRDNSAATAGAGIFNESALAVISNSTVSGNSLAVNGAGIYNSVGGTLRITNSTITGNSAQNVGGGIANFGDTVTVTDCTISRNSAAAIGGGAYGPLVVADSIIAGNTS
jgi:hypothetical protein